MSIPYVPQGTHKRFHVPRTLAADFDAFLANDIPNTVMDFEHVRNWYDRTKDYYRPRFIRGELYPDSTKSRYENTDNNMNIRCSLKSGIRKGDMVIEPDKTVYILDWNGHKESNNVPSRALRCNMMLEVKRFKEVEVDEEGYVVDGEYEYYDSVQGTWETVVHSIPCNAYRYDGRPEYVAVSGTPGATVNALTLMTVQYNNETKNIRIEDSFDWGGETYTVIDIDRVGVDITETYGTLKLQVRKKAGGLRGYE